jgi:hypothetical protein
MYWSYKFSLFFFISTFNIAFIVSEILYFLLFFFNLS